MRSPPWRGGVGVRADVLREFKGTEPMTRNRTVENCDNAASNPCLPNAAPPTAVAWEFIVGWSNGPTVGCINSVASESATNAVQTFTKHS